MFWLGIFSAAMGRVLTGMLPSGRRLVDHDALEKQTLLNFTKMNIMEE